MYFLKKIVDFYIFSNIHVALAGFCLTKITLFNFGITDSLTPFFVAFSIIISYNFIRFFEIKIERLDWFRNWFFDHKKSLLFVSLLSGFFLLKILFFSSFNFKSILILLPFAFMTLFYVIPLLKIKNLEISFRNFPSIKIVSIAIAWAGITVLFPLYEAKYIFNFNVCIEFMQRFLFLIVIIIPFDIRDVNIDSKSLKTLPQILGVKNSKIIGYILLIGLIFLELFKNSIFSTEFFVILAVSSLTALLLKFSSPNKTRYYTSFWVEGIPILWLFLILLFNS